MKFLIFNNHFSSTRPNIRHFILVSIFFYTNILNAQFYKIEKYTELDGLISSSVNTIFQDKRDYLWIGTKNGLSLYNGYEFKNYTRNNGLNNDFVKCIFQSDDNTIWIGTNEGLNKITNSGGYNKSIISVEKGVIVTSITEYRDTIYFSSNLGLHKIISKDSTILIELPRIRALKLINGKLLIGASNGLYEYNSERQEFLRIWNSIDPGTGFVRTILKYPNSKLLLGTMSGLIELDLESKQHSIKANLNRISHMILDSKNRIWVASENGMKRVTQKGLLEFSDSEFNGSCSFVLEDHESNIWVASEEGLLKYTEYPFDRKDFSQDKEANGISTILLTSTNEIWYGGANGKIWIEDSNDRHKNFEEISPFTDSKPVNELFEDSENRIWISTLLKGVFVWDGKGLKQFEDPKGVIRFFNFDIEEDGDGSIWFGGARGLVKYSDNNYEYFTFLNANQTPFVNDIHIDKVGKIWLALNSGIGIIRDNKIIRIPFFDGKTYSQISSDNNGALYAASANFGLVKFRYDQDSLKIGQSYKLETGLSNNNANSVLIDDNENIWVGTEFGINRINKSGNINIYKVDEDLLRSKCYMNSIIETPSNILFGTYDGVIEISKSDSNEKTENINTYIIGISILNENYDSADVKYDSLSYNLPINLILPYNANFVSFSFEGLSFKVSEGLEYQYKLIGLEKEFSEPVQERNFTYANLDNGNYIFKVRSRKPNEKWSEEIASFSFKIKPPFWEEWWFRILIISVFFGSIFLIVNNRIQNIRKEEKEKSELNQKIAEFRLTALRAQMNPHFIFNALYSIQHFITINEKESAINYLAKFASLIRSILENSGKNEISLTDERKMLDLYLDLEKLRFDNKFQYTIQVDQAIHEEDTTIPYLLIQPFVENAVIHGVGFKKENGRISISFIPTNDEDLICCIVEDNGVGRQAAEKLKKPNPIKSQSLGLKVNKERLEILNPDKSKNTSVKIIDLKDESGEPSGTRIEITIPIS